MFVRRRGKAHSKKHSHKKINDNHTDENEEVVIEELPFHMAEDDKSGIVKHTLRYHKSLMENDANKNDSDELDNIEKFSYHAKKGGRIT